MDTFWIFWAFVAGGVATISMDVNNWNRPVTRKFLLQATGFLFVGVGVPVLWTITWHPTQDNLWQVTLILGTSVCFVVFITGLVLVLCLQKLWEKRKTTA